MIDIRELRIGNYVLPNNTIGAQSAVGVVFSINDYLVSVKGNSNQYDYHLLEGVSLTEKSWWMPDLIMFLIVNVFQKRLEISLLLV